MRVEKGGRGEEGGDVLARWVGDREGGGMVMRVLGDGTERGGGRESALYLPELAGAGHGGWGLERYTVMGAVDRGSSGGGCDG